MRVILLGLAAAAAMTAGCGSSGDGSDGPIQLGYYDGGRFISGAVLISPNNLGLGESAALQVNLWDTAADQPYSGTASVDFDIACIAAGKGTLSAVTHDSAAARYTATFTDAGCAGEYTITASAVVTDTSGIDTTLTATGTVVVGGTVSEGLPDQAHFSLSLETGNPEALNYDNETVNVTILLADQFGNPVRDGTTVHFVAEGGAIDPDCVTTDGACTVAWRSQDPRPPALLADGTATTAGDAARVNNAGRATITAWAEGVESFVDLDHDGIFSDGDTFGSANAGDPTYARRDLEAPYADNNEDGAPDAGEFRPDYDEDGNFEPDGLYNGVLCTDTTGRCAAAQKLFIFDNAVIVMAGSSAVIDFLDGSGGTLSALDVRGGSDTVTIWVRDVNGNTLPMDATVSVTTDGVGALPSVTGGDLTIPLNRSATGHTLSPLVTDSDTADDGSGNLIVTVTTPRGHVTMATLPLTY